MAVIGASTDSSKVGNAVLANLLQGNFSGPVYPVNAEHRSVRGVRAYPTVRDIPDDVDRAVVAVPAESIDAVLDDCLAKGVKALVVVSAGFGETGPDGRDSERRLVHAARAHGMRLIGPNALGVANNDVAVSLNATLAPVLPKPGRVGFFCQSGALGIAILDQAAKRHLGLSTFVSAGNRADVSGNDLLQYWDTDPDTEVVLLYLESFGNPGSSPGSLAGSLETSRSWRSRAAATRVPRRSRRRGSRWTTRSCGRCSSRPASYRSARSRSSSTAHCSSVISRYRPGREWRWSATRPRSACWPSTRRGARACRWGSPSISVRSHTEVFADAVSTALASFDVDAVIAVFAPPAVAVAVEPYAQALREAVVDTDKPILTTFLAPRASRTSSLCAGPTVSRRGGRSRRSPPRAGGAGPGAIVALRGVAGPAGIEGGPSQRHRLRSGAHSRRELAGGVERPLAVGLRGRAVARVLRVPVVEFRAATTEDEAVAAADELGYPVAVKATGELWRHRPDLGGVRLDLVGPDSVRLAYRDLAAASGEPLLHVQKMATRASAALSGYRTTPRSAR